MDEGALLEAGQDPQEALLPRTRFRLFGGRQSQLRDRKEKNQREKRGALPAIEFNFRRRRRFLRLRA